MSLAGGVRVDEPGADLAIALALASAAKGMPLGGERPLAAFGEIGLTGELRAVAHHERRVSEAEKFGLRRCSRPARARRRFARRSGGRSRELEPSVAAA